MTTITPENWPFHWVGAYRADAVEFQLEANCTCGGNVVALFLRYGQRPIVCDACPGVFPDRTLAPWVADGRKFIVAQGQGTR